MVSWYTLYTKPNAEMRVMHALEARGFEVYLPLLPFQAGKPPEPLFPCYLFVRCDLSAIGISAFRWIPGLRRLVSFAGRPAILPDTAVELIQAQLREIEAQGGLPRHHFKIGDEVVIQAGPLAGLRGVFQGPLKPAERVQILIRFLGAANRTEIPVEWLQPASAVDSSGRADGSGPNAPRPHRRGTRGRGRRIHYRTAT